MPVSKIIPFLVGLFVLSFTVKAQEIAVPTTDSIEVVVPDSLIASILQAVDSALVAEGILSAQRTFKPNSTKAVLYSALLPGLGQIYNRKYWKLPLVYGGLMGFAYAITWNNKNYQDYTKAYKEIMYDALHHPDNAEAWHSSWQSYKVDAKATDSGLQNQLKGKKDYFRRYRDLSIILTAGFYFLCMIDAYVDAEMFDFDISPDLSMRVEPVITPATSASARTVGLSCRIKF